MRISFSSRLHDRRGAAAAFLLAVCALIAGGATMQDRSLTIADFEGATIETRSGLTMMPYADEQFGGTSDARISLIHPGANGSRGALRIVFRVTAEFANPFAGAWAMVGAEGLDFEFCNVLVNYDLPWNPMEVEQRIGRLDRFGQRHEKIFIYNLRVPGTIDDNTRN